LRDAPVTEQTRSARRGTQGTKEPFVPQGDRPEVKINLDTPLSDLRVRELSAILGYMTGKNANFEVGKTSLKDFFDKPFPEVAKDWVKEIKPEKVEKPEKPEKFEKNEKLEKWEKLEKDEKVEKPERKELKHEKLEKLEKLENDGLVLERPDLPGPDPRIEQIVQVMAGLTEQVGRLANQVDALEKKGRG
jgi:hypothetical protein